MKNPAPLGKCCRCGHQDATRSHECRRCHYITLCMVTIHSIWKLDELEELSEKLAKVTTSQFIELSKTQGAYLRTKLGNTIRRLAYPAGIPADDLKSGVVDAIRRYVGEMQGIADYEAKPGNAGKWMQHWRAAVAEIIQAASKAVKARAA